MKLTIKTEALRKALKLADSMPGGAITDELIVRFKAEKKSLTCTRLNQTSVIHSMAECVTKKAGTANVNSKTLGEMLSNVSTEEVSLEMSGDVLNVSAGKAVGKFKTIPDDVLTPEPNINASERDLVFKAGQLKALLEITRPAMAIEAQNKPFAQGVTLQDFDGVIHFIGTDSRRFHAVSCGLEEKIHELIPDQVCLSLLKIVSLLEPQADVTIGFNMGAIFFNGGVCEFRSAKLEQAPFNFTGSKEKPGMWQVLNAGQIAEITVPKQTLISAVKLATPFGFNDGRTVSFNIQKGKLSIEANTEKGAECNQEVEGKNKGEAQTSLSAPYFMQALQATNGTENVTLRRLETPPAIFMKDEERFLLVMGIRDARANLNPPETVKGFEEEK